MTRTLERATAYGAVAPALAAGYLGGPRGEVGAAVALSVVAVLFFVLRLRLAGVLPSLDLDLRHRHARAVRAVGVVVGAGLVVGASMTGTMGAAPVGTASADAAWTANDCTWGDKVLGVLLTVGEDYDDGCVSRSTVEEIQNISDNQTALDIYSAASTNAQTWNSTRKVRLNYLEDLGTVAYSKGQAAAYAAYSNETDVNGDGNFSQADMALAGRQAVKNFTAQKERNFYERFETQSIALLELSKRAQNESGVSNSTIQTAWQGGAGDVVRNVVKSYNYTTKLVNGTNITLKLAANQYDGVIAPTTAGQPPNFDNSDGAEIRVAGVDGKPDLNYLKVSKTAKVVTKFENVTQRASGNVAKWANGSYESLENGTLNASEALNAGTLAQEYAQRSNESGYFAYAAASLASAGLSTPDLNSTASMQIRYTVNRTVDNTTYTNETVLTGLLMSQNPPTSGTWENGTTYDPTAISGEQLFASQEWGLRELTSNFTVVSIQNKEGENIQNTTVKRYNYQAVNNSEYTALQEELTALRIEMESREPNLGSGGFGATSQGVLIIAAVGVVLYATRRT